MCRTSFSNQFSSIAADRHPRLTRSSFSVTLRAFFSVLVEVSMRRMFLFVVLFGSLFCACEKLDTPKQADRLTTRQALSKAASPTAEIGESCIANGESNCKSGLCLNVLIANQQAYVCSVPCRTGNECPNKWDCAEVAPATSVCIPPQNWRYERAQFRTSASAARVPEDNSDSGVWTNIGHVPDSGAPR